MHLFNSDAPKMLFFGQPRRQWLRDAGKRKSISCLLFFAELVLLSHGKILACTLSLSHNVSRRQF